ncbi:MAG: addiction module toxin RelE [Desulfitobacteriaceae bacterium]|nr:addiction module toxin RelE [Desulfitobacteriaceae bacterium]
MTRKFRSTCKFDKHYQALSKACKKQVLKSIELFIANPSHPSLRFKKIQGTEGFFELSVNQSLRIIIRVETSGQEQINTFYIIGKHEQVFPVK